MAIYESEHTGVKIDEVIGGVFKTNPVVVNADEATGDEWLYVNGRAVIKDLDVTGTISGSVATTLIGLTDTPATYDSGKYLRSTASGTEWATVSGGTTNHSTLSNLDYASSGHTGFQPAGDYATNADLTTASGNIVSQIPTDYYTQGQVDTISGAINTDLTDHTSDATIHFTEASIDHSAIDNLSFAASGHTGFASSASLTSVSGSLQTQIDDKFDSAGGTISGNVVIEGNLTVTGTEFIQHVETVEIDDNLLLINANETGGGVTKGWAGIEVDRGTETNYQFMFVEADNNFQVGISGSLQPVATRKDSADMDDTYVPYWDAANYRFITDDSVAYNEIATTTDLATVSGALNTSKADKSNVLELDNTDAFTPDADYEPATKKYVDDNTISELADDTSPDLGGNLTMGAYNIIATASPSSDHTASGLIASMTVGESVVFGDVLYMKSDGKLWKSDASADTTMPVMAMAIASISADAAGQVLLQGFVRDDTYAMTVGGVVFASTTAGAVTQTAPSSTGDQVQAIGVATHADRILFNPAYVTAEVA